jgi:hypothetical protein
MADVTEANFFLSNKYKHRKILQVNVIDFSKFYTSYNKPFIVL